ncbi:hypothetical protein AGMMS49928_10160 [Spirochaetia bacterium]|nr:hypothetical protein AGMMS49928_10160 [Spirochaetia bacterium]
MKKKALLVLVLVAVLSGGIFAQEKKNFVGVTAGLVEYGAHYERALTPQFSVGVEAYWNNFLFFWNTWGMEAFGRFYPFSNGFHVGVGLGYGVYTGNQDFEYNNKLGTWLATIEGVLIEPEMGWKIDFGQPGGLFLEPAFSLPFVLGSRTFALDLGKSGRDFGVGVNGRVHLGLGWGF